MASWAGSSFECHEPLPPSCGVGVVGVAGVDGVVVVPAGMASKAIKLTLEKVSRETTVRDELAPSGSIPVGRPGGNAGGRHRGDGRAFVQARIIGDQKVGEIQAEG